MESGMTRTTISQDIQDIASAFDQSGRTTQPIKVVAAESTIRRLISRGIGFSKDDGGGLYFEMHPLHLLPKKG